MGRLLIAANVALLLATTLVAQSGIGPIMMLPGRVDSNNALVVTSAAAGTVNTQGSPIGNLPGKVDSSNNLVVTIGGGTGTFGDGACGTTPSIAFANDPDTGFYSASANTIGVCAGGTAGPTFTSTQVNIPAAAQFRSAGNGTNIQFPADGVLSFNDNGAVDGIRFQFNAAPTIGSGFGASPSVVANSTDTVGQINVGTGGAATTGVMNFNATWAVAPLCIIQDATNNTATRITASTTTTMTVTAAAAWAASDILTYICIGHK
jgi:hypothetical protein